MDYCYDPIWDSFANDTTEENYTITTSAPTVTPTMAPTEDILLFSTSVDDDGLTELVNLGWSPSETLYECQGDCDFDHDCDGSMLCYHDGIPPGCTGTYTSYMDYCYDPNWDRFANETTEENYTIATTDHPTSTPTAHAQPETSTTSSSDLTALQNMGWHVNFTLTECQGDCDDDSDCLGALVCWQRRITDGPPPGCSGTPVHTMDYCYDPTFNATHLAAPTLEPTTDPTIEPTMEPTTEPTEDISDTVFDSVLLSRTGSFQPVQGMVIGNITISDVMRYEMDIDIHEFISGWGSILHCGEYSISNISSNKWYETLYPGIWMHPYYNDGSSSWGEGLYISFSSTTDDWVETFSGTSLVPGRSYHLEIDLYPGYYSIKIDGHEVYQNKSVHNTAHSVSCYAGDPLFDAANVTISNLLISTASSFEFVTTESDDGLLELVNLGWSPNETLYECEGDCDGDDDCDAGLQCHHDSIPPGCTGSVVSGMDYCYDPFWDDFTNDTTGENYTISTSAPTTTPA